MLMKCRPGSIILITSRSKGILTDLLRLREQCMKQVQVRGDDVKVYQVLEIPSLNELEAMEVLKSYSCLSPYIPEDCLRSLARSCFFGDQCHPLCLKLKGSQLRERGRVSFNDENWKSLISMLGENAAVEDEDYEKAVLQVVGKSFHGLPSLLKDIFVYMATCELLLSEVEQVIMMLRLLQYDEDCTQDELRMNVINVLEYHGLVEIIINVEVTCEGERTLERLVIHDLHKQVAKVPSAAACGLCAAPHNVNGRFQYYGSEDLSKVSAQEVMTRKHVLGHNVPQSTWNALFPHYNILSAWKRGGAKAQTRYLHLDCGPNRRQLQLGVGKMMGLRALRLASEYYTSELSNLREIGGWEGVPNLVWLELVKHPFLEKMGSIGCLTKLERLIIENCGLKKLETIVGDDDRKSLVRVGDHFPKLQILDLSYSCKNLVEVGPVFSAVFPALKMLNLNGCENLKSFPDLKSGSLCLLDLSWGVQLRAMEGSICSLAALRHLYLNGCRKVEIMPDMSRVVSLQSLNIAGACWWSFVTHINSNVNVPLRHLNTANSTNNRSTSAAGTNCLDVKLPLLPAADADDGETYDSRQQLQAGILEVDGLHQSHPIVQVCDALHGTGICVNFNRLIHLQHLWIDADGGASTPAIVGSLNLSDLPSLRIVYLRSFESVRKLSFSSANLKEVSIKDFPCLEEICGFGAHDLHLHKIKISGCPLLVNTPGLDAALPLKKLQILKCDGLNPWFPMSLQILELDFSSWPNLSNLAALKCLVSLTLNRWDGCSLLAGLTSLKSLHLKDCPALIDTSSLACLTSLKSLELRDCPALIDISSLACLTSLESLHLYDCPALIDISSLARLTSLINLRLGKCSALADVSSLVGLTSSSLLWISDCPSLRKLPDMKHSTGLSIYVDGKPYSESGSRAVQRRGLF